jgi:hypothetical protein
MSGFIGFFRPLLLGLIFRPTTLAPSSEFSVSWVIIFLLVQNDKLLIQPYRKLARTAFSASLIAFH